MDKTTIFKNLINSNTAVLLDGGFGTELFKRGYPVNKDTVLAVFTHPETVEGIHRSYINAGSNIIFADTFGANRFKMAEYDYSVEETIERAVSIAKKASEGTNTLVAVDVSTTGKLLYPTGDLSIDEAYECYKEVALCGEKAGADLFALETFTDLREARIALLAIKENSSLPVTVTVTFDENGKTMNGSTPEAAAVALNAIGADAVGLNCSLGPDKLKNIAEKFLKYSKTPVIVKPNAGLPDPKTGEYSMKPQEFSEYMAEFYKMGVSILGGCCGTNPQYISAVKEAINGKAKGVAENANENILSGISEIISLNEPRIIGERINPTGKKRFKKALEDNDLDYILNEGISQVEAGAEILDVNVGHNGIDERKMMGSVISTLQGTIGLPLQIDTTSPVVLETALKNYCGKPIINSVNGEEKSLNSVLPLAKKYGAMVVGLTLDENGIPETVDGRVAIAEKIINRATALGIPKSDIIIDCLTLTVSVNGEAPSVTLEAMKRVKEKFGVKTTLGVSNISFGLPSREIINTAFLTLALENGLDLPIMNPNTPSMTNAFRAFKVLRDIDKSAESYINNVSQDTSAPQAKELTLFEAVEKGLSSKGEELTKKALTEMSADELINNILIPALDKVGESFEKGKLFLPQLIRSADCAGACFNIIKEQMKSLNANTEPKGKILLATVKGDVHDIGKNIVKTVLENYGYEVVDLGKDVTPEEIVKVQKEQNIKLVGLSALMTTTLPSMEETIRLLRKVNADCKIMVGGAVLTEDYALKIGADYYVKDAKADVDIAKSLFFGE